MVGPNNPPASRGFMDALGDGFSGMMNRVRNLPSDSQNNWMLWGLGALGAVMGLMSSEGGIMGLLSGDGILRMIMFALAVPLIVQALGGFAEGAMGQGRSLLPGGRAPAPGGQGHQRGQASEPGYYIPGQGYVPRQHSSVDQPGQIPVAQVNNEIPATLASLNPKDLAVSGGLQVSDAAPGQPMRPGASPAVEREAGLQPSTSS